MGAFIVLIGFHLLLHHRTFSQSSFGTISTQFEPTSDQSTLTTGYSDDFTYTTYNRFESTTDQSISTTGFAEYDCVNGKDSINSNIFYQTTTTGYCDCTFDGIPYFTGNFCENVLFNNELLNTTTSARTGNFTWPTTPMISENIYSFVYKAIEITDEPFLGVLSNPNYNLILKQEFNMVTETVARIIELSSGEITYKVCVVNNTIADEIVESQNHTMLNMTTSCLELTTQNSILYEYTLAAYIIAFLMILIFIILIVLKFVTDIKFKNQQDSCDKISGQSNDSNDTTMEKKTKKQPEQRGHLINDIDDEDETGDSVEERKILQYDNPALIPRDQFDNNGDQDIEADYDDRSIYDNSIVTNENMEEEPEADY